jgi:hypothetical protein
VKKIKRVVKIGIRVLENLRKETKAALRRSSDRVRVLK